VTVFTPGLFDAVVSELMEAFEVDRPPVPVELMLKRPRPGMWREPNLGDMSLSFIQISSPFSPRMSIARLLARHVCGCPWGEARGLRRDHPDEDIRYLARAILMPARMVAGVPEAQRDPLDLSARFEVPESDALARLQDLGYGVD
jgi:hypothetical protein